MFPKRGSWSVDLVESLSMFWDTELRPPRMQLLGCAHERQSTYRITWAPSEVAYTVVLCRMPATSATLVS